MRIRRLALLLLSCVAIILIGISIISIIVSKTASSNLTDCDIDNANPLDCNSGADIDLFPLPEVGSARGGLSGIQFRGISLSGGEIAETPDKVVEQGAFLPFDDDATLFVYKGMNTFRIPIAWEYWADINGNVLKTHRYFDLLQNVVGQLLVKNATVIIDVHNYMRYNPNNLSLNLLNTNPNGDDIIGRGDKAPSIEAITRFWNQIVSIFSAPNIVYSIMNAPHDVSFSIIRRYTNRAVAAIRNTETALGISPENAHLILVEGNNFSRLESWFSDTTNFTNSNDEMFNLPIIDSANNNAISVRQYFDKDGSGRYVDGQCLSLVQVRNSFDRYWPLFTNWAISRKVKIFISEFGVPDTPQCREVMNYVLIQWEGFPFTQEKQAGLIGWTVWGGGHRGPLWGQEPLSLDAGGRANLLIWNNVLYERFLPSFPLPIPELSGNRIAVSIINSSPFDLIFVFGYVPFQFKGSMNIIANRTTNNIGHFYSNNNSPDPTGPLEIQYMFDNDSTKLLTFRFTETGQFIIDIRPSSQIVVIHSNLCGGRCYQVFTPII